MATASWIRDLLDSRGVGYEELRHPETFTAQETAAREHVSGHRFAKVVVVMADGRPVITVLPASRHVVLERLREALRAGEVRLATEDEMQEWFPECEPGAIPPLRHWEDVDVVMDVSMDVGGEIVFQAGTHRDAVRLDFNEWLNTVNPRVGEFTEPGDHPAGDGVHATGETRNGEPSWAQTRKWLLDLIEVLKLQAKEIERLEQHVEQHTDRVLAPTQMPLIDSLLTELRFEISHKRSD